MEDEEESEINASLAIFDKRLSSNVLKGSAATRTSSFLFYVVSDKKNEFPMNLKCILCGSPCSVNYGKNGLETAAITNHLNDCHHQLHNGMKKCFPKVGNFTHGVDLEILHPKKREAITQTTLNKLFNIQSPPKIINGERKRVKETTSERSKSMEDKHTGSQLTLETTKSNVSTKNSLVQPKEDSILTRPSDFMVITKQNSNKLILFKRVLSLVISGMPLSWNQSNQRLKTLLTEEEYKEEAGVFNFLLLQTMATYKEFDQYSPIMINCVKEVLKSNIQHLNSFSLCTDAWSVTKPAVHLQAVMLCFFRRNKFMSLLLDSVPISSTSAEELNTANKSVLIDYGIEDRSVFITSDGAHSNLKAYGSNRAECNSHKLDNIVRHFIWAASYPKAKKESRHGLSWNESNIIVKHFEYLGDICKNVKSQSGQSFKYFIEKFKILNHDYEESIRLPCLFCETRWIHVSGQMQWILKYGRLYHRYQLAKNSIQAELVKHLKTTEETAWLIFLLEKAMNLMTPSNKPTLHLVLPIREALSVVVNSEPCTSFKSAEAQAMIKAIKYELNEGILSIQESEYYQKCKVATALYPFASFIIKDETLKNYVDVAREYYRVFEDRLKQSGVELSNKSFDAVMNQIHSREQESPFYPEHHDNGNGIYSSPMSFIDSHHGRNYLVELIMPSSQKLMLFGSGTLSLSYYEGIDMLEYRKKKISLMEALQILDKKAEEIEEEEMTMLSLDGSGMKAVNPYYPSQSHGTKRYGEKKQRRKIRVRVRRQSTESVLLCVNQRRTNV